LSFNAKHWTIQTSGTLLFSTSTRTVHYDCLTVLPEMLKGVVLGLIGGSCMAVLRHIFFLYCDNSRAACSRNNAQDDEACSSPWQHLQPTVDATEVASPALATADMEWI
jgi:hypothetical protein